jgi:hypothetical protein
MRISDVLFNLNLLSSHVVSFLSFICKKERYRCAAKNYVDTQGCSGGRVTGYGTRRAHLREKNFSFR